MPVRMKTTRLLVGLALGLAFFGCVGVPRRVPPTEAVTGTPNTREQQDRTSAAPSLRIPIDATPSPAGTTTPIADPALVRASAPPSQPPPEPDRGNKSPDSPAPSTMPNSLAALRRLHQESVQVNDSLDSFIVRLTRREALHGKMQPEEVIQFKFRKQPKSVYFQWLGSVAHGREVIWVQGQHEGKIHTLLAPGDMPLFPAGGKVMSLSPDSIFVKSSSRHSITQAGFDSLLNQFGRLLDALEKGDTHLGSARYLGRVKREEFTQPVEGVEWSIPPKLEPSLPQGGRRLCYVDPESHLPVLILTYDEHGKEVEYYRYERYLLSVHLDDDDFNPDKVFKKPAK
jgi:Protein of unknown function (DUF1571)